MMARRVEVRLDDLKVPGRRAHGRGVAQPQPHRPPGAEIDKRDAMLAERDARSPGSRSRWRRWRPELEARTEALHSFRTSTARAARRTRPAPGRGRARPRDRAAARRGRPAGRRPLRCGVARAQRAGAAEGAHRGPVGPVAPDRGATARAGMQQSQSQALREAAGQGHPERAEAGEERPSRRQQEPVEHRIEDAERQASELQSELDRLDEIWAAKLADVAQRGRRPAAGCRGAPGSEPSPADIPRPVAVNGNAGQPVAARGGERPEDAGPGRQEDAGPGQRHLARPAHPRPAAQRVVRRRDEVPSSEPPDRQSVKKNSGGGEPSSGRDVTGSVPRDRAQPPQHGVAQDQIFRRGLPSLGRRPLGRAGSPPNPHLPGLFFSRSMAPLTCSGLTRAPKA
jgi:hypothetical protein